MCIVLFLIQVIGMSIFLGVRKGLDTRLFIQARRVSFNHMHILYILVGYNISYHLYLYEKQLSYQFFTSNFDLQLCAHGMETSLFSVLVNHSIA